jgi:peptidoglycan/xylan/chitin deacetylase (PgdA/CDA1 family)
MTTIITLQYNQLDCLSSEERPNKFLKHFELLRRQYPIVTPGEPIPKSTIALCLTFEDASIGFYEHLFPLLTKYQIKAVLGVSTLALKSRSLSQNHCSVNMLKTMAQSGWVKLATKGHTNSSLTNKKTDLIEELIDSKQFLMDHTQSDVDYFIYPDGKYNRRIHHFVKHYYEWGFGQGNAFNVGFPERTRLLHRIDATPFWQNNQAFLASDLAKWQRNYWLHRLLGW